MFEKDKTNIFLRNFYKVAPETSGSIYPLTRRHPERTGASHNNINMYKQWALVQGFFSPTDIIIMVENDRKIIQFVHIIHSGQTENPYDLERGFQM